MAVPSEQLSAITKFCEKRVPWRLQDTVRVACTARGNAVTITESRPLWAGISEEWVSHRIAQLRFDPASETWTLFWSDGNARWLPLEGVTPSSVTVMLKELETDRHGVFWG